jgi:hypothetical protein
MAQLQPALSALGAIGAPVSDVVYRGSFAFVAQKGYSYKTVLSKSNDAFSPANVNVIIEGYTHISMNSYPSAVH